MKVLVIFIALLLPSIAFAKADLKIEQNDIRLSRETIVAGDQVRLYASVHNIGDEDVSGYVTFYQGSNLVGASQVISVLANGSAEEVYIDFIVPSSSFNIQAQVEGTDPTDEDESNNVAITSLYQPILDDDRDGVANGDDDCPTIADASQADSDGDGLGDLCDTDDDNDGLSDEIETEIGTNSLMTDTDGDGVEDQSDAFPTDPERVSEQEEAEQGQEQKQEEGASVTFKELISQVAQTIQESSTDEPDEVEGSQATTSAPEEGLETAEMTVSPNAIFRYTRDAWNTFTFMEVGSVDDDRILFWDFGDGVTSSKSVVVHTYGASGTYTATLTLKDAAGETVSEQTIVRVPFFSLQNPVVLVAVVFLSLLLLIALATLGSGFFKRRMPMRPS
ncbi:PKD domain-containing protein [Candidatus Uhrbacteria bacterium]|nr:PKD domain-containing protein [Candidatus Uhrbacteria bacterium]